MKASWGKDQGAKEPRRVKSEEGMGCGEEMCERDVTGLGPCGKD